MKRILCAVLVLILLCSCAPLESGGSQGESIKNDYIKGVWLSFSELDNMLASGNFKSEFDLALSNCKARGITDMFVHIRAFCDSIYPSKYFPLRESTKSYDFDILSFMVEQCHKAGIKLHAWINPYRVRSADSDISALNPLSPAYKWLNDESAENDNNVCISGGIYLNPASSEVRRLVIDGIREAMENYPVDGIHFDDYFYPTQDEAFDKSLYEKYCADTEKPLTLSDWRRANVNALISGVYTAVKFKDKNIIFSVSPAASAQKDYDKLYADVDAWIKSGCVDWIIPQLYFGFDYPDREYRFENLLADWQKRAAAGEARLLIGLASYKIGTNAEPDRKEWQNGKQVIKRQIELCTSNPDISGHIFFSYSSMTKHIN